METGSPFAPNFLIVAGCGSAGLVLCLAWSRVGFFLRGVFEGVEEFAAGGDLIRWDNGRSTVLAPLPGAIRVVPTAKRAAAKSAAKPAAKRAAAKR